LRSDSNASQLSLLTKQLDATLFQSSFTGVVVMGGNDSLQSALSPPTSIPSPSAAIMTLSASPVDITMAMTSGETMATDAAFIVKPKPIAAAMPSMPNGHAAPKRRRTLKNRKNKNG
jgi:hypothetical protein